MSHSTSLGAEQAEFVRDRRVGYLATVLPDGGPHVVPISTASDGARLVFATERATQKVRNIGSHAAVAIAFDAYDEDWSVLRQVIVFGRAEIIPQGEEFEKGRDLLYTKYPQYPIDAPILEGESVVVAVSIERVYSLGFK